MLFWKKDKAEFERGEFVKVKNGVKYPKLKVDISDWHGRVKEVYKRTVEVELDSITLMSFNERLVNHYKENREYPHLVTIPKKDIERSEPRDKYEDVEPAQDELIAKLDIEEEGDPEFQKLSRRWIRHFVRSEIYESMDRRLRLETDSVIELFTNQMYEYEGKSPKKWTVRSAKAVFLNWAPSKITADQEFFESYGEVLLKYFEFLEERRYLKTKSLQELLSKVKDEIVVRSQDRSNWGMAKSIMMGAQESGVNLDNKRELEEYMMGQQLKALDNLRGKQGNEVGDMNVVDKRKFKGIWRNQKIQVRYSNGEIKEAKFKDLEQELLMGICELIEK